jgi:hypothetical protein
MPRWMTTDFERNVMRFVPRSELPLFVKLGWVACVPAATLLACELLWEKTWLTWTHGPQIIGFWIGHVFAGPMIYAILATYATFIWIGVAFVCAIINRIRWRRGDVLMFGLAAFVVVQALIPAEFILRFASSP